MATSSADVSQAPCPKPPLPEPFLVWYHISKADTFHLNSLPLQSQRQYLSDLLGLRQHYVDSNDPYNAERRQVFLDLCVHLLRFCRKQTFSAEKTSTFLSLLYVTHTFCCETPGPLITVEEGYTFFERQLLKHSVERPPFSIAVFSFHDIKKVADYVVNSYFRHLKMYQYVFGVTRELELAPVYSQATQVDKSLFPSLDDAFEYKSTEATSVSDVLSLPHPSQTILEEEEVPNVLNVDAAADEFSGVSMRGGDLNPEDRQRFDQTLTGEMTRLRAEFAAKLQEQEANFTQRLAEATAKPRTGKKR